MPHLRQPSAYLLVSHGSRDPRPQVAIEHLAKLVAQRLQPSRRLESVVAATALPEARSILEAQFPWVGIATLECAPLPLHQQIVEFASAVAAQGYSQIQIVPLFLLPGVHVMDDIPAEVAMAQPNLPNEMRLWLRPYLGSHPELGRLLINPVDPVATSPHSGKIVFAHGSRRPGSDQPVAAIATSLSALPAYWAVPPSLETQVTALVKQGCQQIAILPYFLFEGGITDAIAQEVDRLAQHFPYLRLQLNRPLGATPQLADLVVDLIA